MSDLSCNKIFSMWEKKNLEVYDTIRDKLGSKINIYVNEYRCLRKILTQYNLLIKDQICHNCDLLSRFTDDNIRKENIEILCGKNKGKYISVLEDGYCQEYTINNYIKYFSNTISKKHAVYYKDEYFDLKNITYYTTKNKLLNLSAISLILKKIATVKKFPMKINYITSYVCQGRIAMLYLKGEHDTFKNISRNPLFRSNISNVKHNGEKLLSVETVSDLLKQCVITLRFYSKFYFLHNELTVDNIVFIPEKNSFIFEDQQFVSPFKVIINPSCYSCISIYNNETNIWGRFNYSEKEKKYPLGLSYCPDVFINETSNYNTTNILNSYDDVYFESRILGYSIGDKKRDFLITRRDIGCPVGLKSFDILTLFISFLLEPYFYETFIKDDCLLTIWKGLWDNAEYPSLMKDMEFLRIENKKEFKDIYTLIVKYKIRFDALDYIYYELFKS